MVNLRLDYATVCGTKYSEHRRSDLREKEVRELVGRVGRMFSL